MNNPCIYSICHPFTDEVKYIGKTCNLKERIKSHYRIANRNPQHAPLYEWIKMWRDSGFDPIFKVIKTCQSDGELSKQERMFINKYEKDGNIFNDANVEKCK